MVDGLPSMLTKTAANYSPFSQPKESDKRKNNNQQIKLSIFCFKFHKPEEGYLLLLHHPLHLPEQYSGKQYGSGEATDSIV